MKLSDWQKQKGISDSVLAELLGISLSYLSRAKRGLRRFSPQKAAKAEEVTGGSVTRWDLLYPGTQQKKGGSQPHP